MGGVPERCGQPQTTEWIHGLGGAGTVARLEWSGAARTQLRARHSAFTPVAQSGFGDRGNHRGVQAPIPPGVGVARGDGGTGQLLMSARKPLLILVAGPYRSGTGEDPAKLAENVRAMEAYALPHRGAATGALRC